MKRSVINNLVIYISKMYNNLGLIVSSLVTNTHLGNHRSSKVYSSTFGRNTIGKRIVSLSKKFL